MKKLLCLFVSLVFFCSGCSNKSSGVAAVTSGLSFNAELTCGGETNTYTVTVAKNGDTVISLESGAVFTFSGDNVTIDYEGLSQNCELQALNKGIYIDFFYTVFRTLRENNTKVHFKEDRYFLTDKTDKYDFTLLIGQSGLPIEINEKNFGIGAVISNASLKS